MKVQNNKNVNNYECLVRRTFYCLGSCPFYPSKTVVRAVKGLQFFHVQYNLHLTGVNKKYIMNIHEVRRRKHYSQFAHLIDGGICEWYQQLISKIPKWHVGLECRSCAGASHTHIAKVRSRI